MRMDTDVANHPFYLSVLGQWEGENRSRLTNYYLHHANAHNQEFGLLLTKFDQEYTTGKDFIDFVFASDESIADWQGVLFYICGATNTNSRRYLLRAVRHRVKQGGRKNLVARLVAMRNRLLDGNG